MFSKILLVAFVCMTLSARENPFMPAKSENFISSNQMVVQKPLRRATMKLPSDARVLQSVTVKYKKLDGSVATQTIELQNSIDWHLPLFISQSYLKEESSLVEEEQKLYKKRKIAQIRYATFYSYNKTLKVVTKDKLLRSFTLVNPHRVVLDFSRVSHLKSYTATPKESIFTKIRIGNHKDYYRVVVELDGYYKVKTEKIDDGYIVKLR